MTAAFDYIVVGAGAAGCVLAYRLSEDPANRVLLIEAGGADRHPFIHMPRGIARIMFNARYLWPFTTRPEAASNDAAEKWSRGRVLGGSSAVNGMVYVRGESANYDRLAELAGDEWSWSKIAAAYRELEAHELGETFTRGGHGPLRISMPEDRDTPWAKAILAAGRDMGLSEVEDVNAAVGQERIGFIPRTIHRGRRQSAAVAFLRPARRRRNLTVATSVAVDRVSFSGTRATGVTGRRRGRPVHYAAAREVILSAGALASPAILQRSGIGPAALLRGLGIAPLIDSPEVGANLCEHRGLQVQWRVGDRLSENRQFRGWRLLANVLRYAVARKGPMAGAAFEIGAWIRTRPGLAQPNAQLLMAPFTFDRSKAPPGVEAQGGMAFGLYQLTPESRGRVRIRSADADALPEIFPNYLSAEEDRRVIVELIDYARRFVRSDALAGLVIDETRPGADIVSDDQVMASYVRLGHGSYHACGTCRMGNDAASVLDPALRVRGVEGLRVVDGSAFPFMLAGNTNAPVMAMAWRAADLILAGAGTPPDGAIIDGPEPENRADRPIELTEEIQE